MTFANILANSTLKPDTTRVIEVKDNSQEPHFVYPPDSWNKPTSLATLPGDLALNTSDPNSINSLQPRNGTMALELNNRPCVTRLSVSDVPLQAGTKYLAKIIITPDVQWVGGKVGTFDSLRYRVAYAYNGVNHNLDWRVAEFSPMSEIVLGTFWAQEATTVSFGFDFWNVWGNLLGNLFIYEIRLEVLPPDYGGNFEPIGMVGGTPSQPPTETPGVPPVARNWTIVAAGVGAILIALIAVFVLWLKTGATAQEVPNMGIDVLIGLGATLALIIEPLKMIFLKSLKARLDWTDFQYGIAVWVAAMAIGVLLAWIGNINAFPSFPPLMGVFITGVAATLPSDVLHKVYDGFAGVAAWFDALGGG